MRWVLVGLIAFGFPLHAMQRVVKQHKVQVQNAGPRQSFCTPWKATVFTLALAAAVFGYTYDPEQPRGCPIECDDAATRFNDEASQQLVVRCKAIRDCFEPGFFSRNEINTNEYGT